MRSELSLIVNAIRGTVIIFIMVYKELSAGNNDLSSRTQEQASALERNRF